MYRETITLYLIILTAAALVIVTFVLPWVWRVLEVIATLG